MISSPKHVLHIIPAKYTHKKCRHDNILVMYWVAPGLIVLLDRSGPVAYNLFCKKLAEIIYEARAFEGLRHGRLQLWWKVASIGVFFIVSLVNLRPWAIRLRVAVKRALKENLFMFVLLVTCIAQNDAFVLHSHGLLKHI